MKRITTQVCERVTDHHISKLFFFFFQNFRFFFSESVLIWDPMHAIDDKCDIMQCHQTWNHSSGSESSISSGDCVSSHIHIMAAYRHALVEAMISVLIRVISLFAQCDIVVYINVTVWSVQCDITLINTDSMASPSWFSTKAWLYAAVVCMWDNTFTRPIARCRPSDSALSHTYSRVIWNIWRVFSESQDTLWSISGEARGAS